MRGEDLHLELGAELAGQGDAQIGPVLLGRRTDPDAYPASFKMTQTDIDTAPEVPTIPPLLARP